MLENKKAGNLNVHYSRYVASWRNMNGNLFGDYFKKWLISEGLTEQEAAEVEEMYCLGKLELEKSARKFIYAQRREMKRIENEPD